jgi:hypothetical protein
MTTRGREVAVRGCLLWSIEHHQACSAAYAAYAQELRCYGWSQPAAGPGQQQGSG